jgi:uncharacterized protein (UPF0332 family)
MNELERATLVRYRLEQAGTALSDAAFLLKGNRSAQSVVNRAYYAMFYAVLALLQHIGAVPTKHIGAIGLFDTEFVKKDLFEKELSQNLHRAFELRQTSDYRVKSVGVEQAEMTLRNAGHFVARIREFFKDKGIIVDP